METATLARTQPAAAPRIIMVEDERVVALHMRRQLSNLGYDVVAVAASGDQALRRIEELRPDLVIMDIRIDGDMDGIETASKIPADTNPALVYLTAYSEDSTLERARATKPYGYLLKPFSERELHATLQMALERRRADMALREQQQGLERMAGELKYEYDRRTDIEKELRETTELLMATFNAAPFAIQIVDPDMNVLMWNPAAETMFGYSADEMIGQSALMTVPDKKKDGVLDGFNEVVSGAPPRRILRPVIHRDGRVRQTYVFAAPIFAPDGRTRAVVVTFEDVTERKQAEDDLRASEERFRSIFGGISEGIFVSSATTGTFIEINDPGRAMFGYEPEELIGKDIEVLSSGVPPYTQRDAVEWIKRAAATGDPQMFGWHCKKKDGQLFWAEISIRLATISGRDVILAIVRDVTARQTMEGQLRQAQKMEAIGNLTGGMAHDFNNLLAIIVGNLDLAKLTLDPKGEAGELAELVDESLGAALRGAELTRRLLAFARRQPLSPSRLSVNQLVSGMVKLLERTLGENITIVLDLAPDLWPVDADATQLETAIVNLATNARDAMPRGGTLTIAARNRRLDEDYAAAFSGLLPGDYAVIEVSDTGSGMAPHVIAQIYEPFYTTKDPGKGTGLGLSMIFGFMMQSGGHVNVYSEVGIGTTFRLYLPRTLNLEADAAPGPSDAAVGAGETILAVEDNEGLRRVVVRQLRDLRYRVFEAESAAAALAFLETEMADLVFTDVVMPGEIDGLMLAKTILHKYPAIKVVLTSGFPDTKLNGALGALTDQVRLLSKPYRKDELAHVLREALG